MIIPPDPEKDPRLFLASTSTPSLLLPPDSEPGSDISDPRNAAFGYPFTDPDVSSGGRPLSIGNGEFLPPYERRSQALAGESRDMRERDRSPGYIGITIPPIPVRSGQFDGFAESEGSITPTASTYATGSTSRLPIPSEPSSATTTLPPGSSTAKLWEGTSTTAPRSKAARWKGKSRAFMGLPIERDRNALGSPTKSDQRWWKRYRRWLWAIGVIGMIGIGLMIGLLAGLRGRFHEIMPMAQSGPAWHDVEPGDSRWSTAWVSLIPDLSELSENNTR